MTHHAEMGWMVERVTRTGASWWSAPPVMAWLGAGAVGGETRLEGCALGVRLELPVGSTAPSRQPPQPRQGARPAQPQLRLHGCDCNQSINCDRSCDRVLRPAAAIAAAVAGLRNCLRPQSRSRARGKSARDTMRRSAHRRATQTCAATHTCLASSYGQILKQALDRKGSVETCGSERSAFFTCDGIILQQ